MKNKFSRRVYFYSKHTHIHIIHLVIKSLIATLFLVYTYSGYSTHPYELLQVPSVGRTSKSTPILTSHEDYSIPSSPSKKIVTFDSDKSSVGTSTEGIKPSHPMAIDTKKKQASTPTCSSSSINQEQDDESKEQDEESKGQDEESKDDLVRTNSSSTLELHSSSQRFSQTTSRKRSGSVAIQRSLDGTQSVVLSKSDDAKFFGSEEEKFLASLTEPEIIVTKDGRATVKELFLPPPPAPDISHIITPSSTTKMLHPSHSRSGSKSPSSRSVSPRQSTPTRDATDKGSHSSLASGRKKATEASLKSKEKLFQPKREKYCLPGNYIVTPFIC